MGQETSNAGVFAEFITTAPELRQLLVWKYGVLIQGHGCNMLNRDTVVPQKE